MGVLRLRVARSAQDDGFIGGDWDGDGQGFGAEALAVTARAGGRGHVLHHVLAIALGAGVVEVGAQIGEYAVKAGAADFVYRRAVEEEVLLRLGQVLERNLQVDLVLVGGELDKAQQVGRSEIGGGPLRSSAGRRGRGPVAPWSGSRTGPSGRSWTCRRRA